MNTIETYRFTQEHPEAVQQGQEAMHALLARSATDADFRQQLLTDPRGAVAAFTGQEVPESINIVFVENKADATIVLPDPIDYSAELTEEELEAVAGGEIGMAIAAVAAVSTIIASGIIIAKNT